MTDVLLTLILVALCFRVVLSIKYAKALRLENDILANLLRSLDADIRVNWQELRAIREHAGFLAGLERTGDYKKLGDDPRDQIPF